MQEKKQFDPNTPVYSYLRFSTPEQRAGTGEKRQTDDAAKWCKDNGLTLKKSYADLGVSAFRGKHRSDVGQLKAFLDRVEDGRVRPGSILIVESLDRLSREEVRHAVQMFLGIVNSGITVVTLSDEQVYSPETFDMTRLIISVAILARAHDESLMKSKRKAASWKYKRNAAVEASKVGKSKVLGGNTPRWIKVVDGHYEVVEAEADRVRRIFRDYANGDGLFVLNKKYGVAKATISYWLNNPVVLGTLSVNEEGKTYAIHNHYPAIINAATWQAVQRAKVRRYIKRRDGKRGWVNVFAGLLYGPAGDKPVVIRNYGFPSYLFKGFTIPVRELEHVLLCNGEKLADKLIRLRDVPIDPNEKVEASPQVGLLDAKIEQIKQQLIEDDSLASDLLPVLRTLRKQRTTEAASTVKVLREKPDHLLLMSMIADVEKPEIRLAVRDMVRDTVDRIEVRKLVAGNHYSIVDGQAFLADKGDTVSFRYAYATRRNGYVMCDGATEITDELRADLEKLPLREKREPRKVDARRKATTSKARAASRRSPVRDRRASIASRP